MGNERSKEQWWEVLEGEAFEVVEKARVSLPEEVRCWAEELPVAMEEVPGEDLLEEGFPPDLLGLFTGENMAERGQTLYPAPAQIILFLRNLWDYAEGNHEAYREEVRITYLHELGHFFGWDEDDLEERGLD